MASTKHTRKYPSMMPKAEWRAPTDLKVGDRAVVLHGYRPKSSEANFSDVICGDTTVVAIDAKGSVTLRNGDRFHATGYGYSRNGAMVLSDRHAIERLPNGMPKLVNGKPIPATTLGFVG